MRKINDLVKRTRYVKVHALLIGHLRNQMPAMFGKEAKKQELLKNMAEVFRAVQREFHLPFGPFFFFFSREHWVGVIAAGSLRLPLPSRQTGDFPDLNRFRENIQDYDFSKFPKLDLK